MKEARKKNRVVKEDESKGEKHTEENGNIEKEKVYDFHFLLFIFSWPQKICTKETSWKKNANVVGARL